MTLSGRLKELVRMVPETRTVADIGCDHGKVAVALVKSGRVQTAICGDISAKSLDKARRLAKENGLIEHISLRKGSGLAVLEKGEAGAAVIAGMGGELIISILETNVEKAPDTLVLSCNRDAHLLRQWLVKNGYRIDDEALVLEDEHFYPVIRAEKGKNSALTEIEAEFGPVTLQKKPPELKLYLKRLIRETEYIRDQLQKAALPEKQTLMNDIDDRLKRYAEVEKCL